MIGMRGNPHSYELGLKEAQRKVKKLFEYVKAVVKSLEKQRARQKINGR